MIQADVPLDDYLESVRRRAKTFFDVEEWASLVAQHDVVVGTRFHGNMIAISQGIASVFVAHDSRTTELCEALNIPFVGLEAFVNADLDQIIESFY